MNQQVDQITTFLASIGLPLESRRLETATLLPGITMECGVIVYDPSLLTWPGDLLHEAGHIAVTPPAIRVTLSDWIPPEQTASHAGEAEATAWAFAAITALGLDPAVLFHPAGYHGKSEGLIVTFMSGCYPGVAGLVACGMALTPAQAAAAGAQPYPAMVRWLRD